MRATLGIAVCGKTARTAVTEGCQRVTAGFYSLFLSAGGNCVRTLEEFHWPDDSRGVSQTMA